MTNPYKKRIGQDENGLSDIYNILHAYKTENSAIDHAIKKLLCAGLRNGGKSKTQDYQEAIESIKRAIELEAGE